MPAERDGSAPVPVMVSGEPEMEALGGRIAHALSPGCLIYLQGDLGTGKTTLVRGLLRGLGHHGGVKSPTYTLVEPYRIGRLRIFHLDLYRLADPEELEWIGFRDLLDGEGICLVEWPERGAGDLPAPDLLIELDYSGKGRRLCFTPGGDCGRSIIRALGVPEGAIRT